MGIISAPASPAPLFARLSTLSVRREALSFDPTKESANAFIERFTSMASSMAPKEGLLEFILQFFFRKSPRRIS